MSSNSSPPLLEDDADSVCYDELLGSQSRLWLTDLLTQGPALSLDVSAASRDGLFVDQYFPVGELELHSGVKWKRPQVKIHSEVVKLLFQGCKIRPADKRCFSKLYSLQTTSDKTHLFAFLSES